MTEELRFEIKESMKSEWDKYPDKIDMCKEFLMQYIFGPRGYNIHINIDSYVEIMREVEAEKNAVVEEG